jgi:transcriptional regulator with XRE-family HTH domain/tetratricopeptide (TPR) repeat protein
MEPVSTTSPTSTLAFGIALKRARKAAGLTQAELAERAAFSVVYIGMLERGARQPQRSTVALLADALVLTPTERAALEAAAHLPSAPPPVKRRAKADADMSRLPVGGFLGALPTSQLVGCERERHAIGAALEAVANGQGRFLLLVGEPGVGKTRLAQEITLLARAQGFRVLTGRCYEPQQSVAYYPFLEALAMAAAGADAAVQEKLAESWPEVARLLPERLASAQAPIAPVQLDDRNAQQRLFWQVSDFVQALAEPAPLALLLDDLHWADTGSLDLLQHLAHHTRERPILLVGTCRAVEAQRQHPLTDTLSDLGRDEIVERLAVRRLGAEETSALIGATLGAHDGAAGDAATVSADLAQRIYARSEGNAFFTRQLARALAEQGTLAFADGQWVLDAAGSALEAPESVRAVIGQRLGRLTPLTQEVLREASVLGQVFLFEDLRRLGGRGEQEVEEALEEATQAGIVREGERDGYGLNHALTRDTLYADLSARKKRRLHRAAAEAIEQQPNHERRAAELSYHLLAADEGERALPYALLAGDQAEAVYAHAEAEKHYQAAVALAREIGDAAREAEACEKLAGALRKLTRLDDALRAVERAALLSRARSDREGELRALAGIAAVHTFAMNQEGLGQQEECLAWLRPRVEALEIELAANGVPTSAGLVAAYCSMAWLYDNLFRWREKDAVAAHAERLAYALGDPAVLVQALEVRAWMNMTLEPSNAMARARELITLAEAVQSHAGRWTGLSLATFSSIYYEADFEQARAYQEHLLELSEQPQAQPNWGDVLSDSGALARFRGEWSRARALFAQVEALVERLDPSATSWRAIYTPLWQGVMDLDEGREERAIRLLEEAISRAERFADGQALTYAQAPLAERDLLCGRAAKAHARLAPLLESEEAGPVVEFVAHLLPLLVWAELLAGQVGQAAANIEAHLASPAGSAVRVHRPDALRVRAMVAIAQEHWDEAEVALEEAVRAANAMPYPHAAAKALYAYGQLYVAKGEPERAREKYQAALAICVRLGEGLYRPYIERDLRRLAQKA